MNEEKLIDWYEIMLTFDQANSKYMGSNFMNTPWRKIGAEIKT